MKERGAEMWKMKQGSRERQIMGKRGRQTDRERGRERERNRVGERGRQRDRGREKGREKETKPVYGELAELCNNMYA